jgi:hypothetical protein
MKFISKMMSKISGALLEVQSPNWSLTKLAMLVFLYPTITGVFIYDVVFHQRMDVTNSLVFICAIVAPRVMSQILAARFGIKPEEKQVDSPQAEPDCPK